MALFSCGVFGYAVNTSFKLFKIILVGGIFSDIAKKTAEFKESKYIITNYMSNRGIS